MRLKFRAGIAALAVMGMMASTSFAQPGGAGGRGGRGGFGGPGMGMGFQSPLGLASIPAVQKELSVTEEQAAKLKTLNEEFRAEMAKGFEEFRNLSEEERTAKRDEIRAKSAENNKKVVEAFEPKLAAVLDAKQVERLKQIALQAAGSQAYSDPAVAKSLKLSKDQEEKIAAIVKDFAAKQRELFPGRGGAGGGGGQGGGAEAFAKMRELGTERDKALEAVLTADQKDQLAKLKGKEFDMAQLRGGFGGPGGAGGPGGGGGRPGGRTRPPQ
jgi:Spy/CpxP family protein refolding chaperone